MISKTARLLVAAVALGAAACGAEAPPPSSAQDLKAEDYRCVGTRADGSCYSLPSNCPVTVHTDVAAPPHCPEGATLTPIADDTCPKKLICVD